jgi:membrane-bound ClpP family serine protease
MAKQKNTPAGVQEEREARMPLGRRNYVLMLIGLAIIIVGFMLMAGGGSDDPAVFNEKMFSFRRITLAPIVVIAGFVFEIYAIMSRKTANKKQ